MYTSGFLDCIKGTASRLGLTVEVVDKANGRVIRVFSASGRAALFGATPIQLWPFNNALSVSVARDKDLTLRLLKEAGIRVPDTVIAFHDAERYSHLDPPPPSASTFAEAPPLEFPVVVKPNDSLAGKGLSFVYEPTSLSNALRYAASHSNGVLIQELLSGKDVRIYGYKGRGILRIERCTRSVPADGRSTAAALLADFPAETEQVRLSLESFIAQYGNQILPGGQRIAPYPAANYCVTGRVGKMSRELSDEERAVCRTVYTSLDLVFCAIDCLVDQDGAVRVLEVNGNPGIEMLYRDSENEAAMEVIDFLVSEAVATQRDNM